MFNYSMLPEHMRGGAQRWIENGILPGSFMTAVLQNNLTEALNRADSINKERLHDIVAFFYNEAPSACWGSPEQVEEWRKKFQGKEDE